MPVGNTLGLPPPVIDCFKGRYEFLDVFYPVIISYDGMEYRSVAAAYHAQRTRDEPTRLRLSHTAVPRVVRAIAKKLEDPPHWNDIRYGIMQRMLRCKFGNRHPDLQARLASTLDTPIRYTETQDSFFGYCNGEGENAMGILLTDARFSIHNYAGQRHVWEATLRAAAWVTGETRIAYLAEQYAMYHVTLLEIGTGNPSAARVQWAIAASEKNVDEETRAAYAIVRHWYGVLSGRARTSLDSFYESDSEPDEDDDNEPTYSESEDTDPDGREANGRDTGNATPGPW